MLIRSPSLCKHFQMWLRTRFNLEWSGAADNPKRLKSLTYKYRFRAKNRVNASSKL